VRGSGIVNEGRRIELLWLLRVPRPPGFNGGARARVWVLNQERVHIQRPVLGKTNATLYGKNGSFVLNSMLQMHVSFRSRRAVMVPHTNTSKSKMPTDCGTHLA
jgi:hypothetical protein